MNLLDCISILKALKADRRGVTAMEYGLIAAAVVAVVGVAFQGLFGRLSTMLGTITFTGTAS